MGKSGRGQGWAPHPGSLPGSSGRHPGSCSGLSWSWSVHLTAGSLSSGEGVGGGGAGHFWTDVNRGLKPQGRRGFPGGREGRPSLGRRRPGLVAQGSTFFRKKFLPDFLSPLLVRTPRCRMYRLMALTTAALWGGDSEGARTDIQAPKDAGTPPPLQLPLHPLHTPTPQPLLAEHLSKRRERRF